MIILDYYYHVDHNRKYEDWLCLLFCPDVFSLCFLSLYDVWYTLFSSLVSVFFSGPITNCWVIAYTMYGI